MRRKVAEVVRPFIQREYQLAERALAEEPPKVARSGTLFAKLDRQRRSAVAE